MSGFTFGESKGVKYLKIDEFENAGGIKAYFTARMGGVSKGGYSSLNLGLKSGDKTENIHENIRIFSSALGIKMEDMVFSDQVHGKFCRVVTADDKGKGVVRESDIKNVDALLTCEENVALCIFTADCVPVFFYDKKNHAAALCHAGWRGVVGGIVCNTIDKMASSFNTSPEDLLTAIGPSIRSCCFNVKDDVVDKFKQVFKNEAGDLIIQKNNINSIDLQKAISLQLRESGIEESNIIDSGLCSSCRNDLFYSYRRDGIETGRMLSVIQLIKEV